MAQRGEGMAVVDFNFDPAVRELANGRKVLV
jgi:hypothetical protein